MDISMSGEEPMSDTILVTAIDPDDPQVMEAIALVTAYQLDTLSAAERQHVEQRLRDDQAFREIVEPILVCGDLMRAAGGRQQAMLAGQAQVLAERVIRMTARQPGQLGQHDGVEDGSRSIDLPSVSGTSRLTSERRRKSARKAGILRRTWRRVDTTKTYVLVGSLSAVIWAYDLYAAEVRLRTPPASVTFQNAPLSVVMAEISRRYHVDVTACDVGFNRDRVTLTLKDVPLDTVLWQVSDQTVRWAHWVGPHTVRLTPQPDIPRGLWYNLKLYLRGFVTGYLGRGCHH